MQYSVLTTALLATAAMAMPNMDLFKRATSIDTGFTFPFLTPAFTFQVPISGIYQVGSNVQGKEIVISANTGVITTESNFTDIVWSGDLVFGNDFLHDFVDAPHRLLDGHGLFNTSTGTMVSWTCSGVTSNTTVPTVTETKARGFAVFVFDTGDESLAALSQHVWVSSLHFVISNSLPMLEFKISRVDYINGTET